MTGKTDDPEYAQVKIVMERSYDNFTDDQKEEFLDDIATVSGSPKKKIRKKRYRRGCVVFEAQMPKAPLARLLDLFQNRQDGNDSDELTLFTRVLAKHRISLIHGQTGTTVQIITSRKSDPKAASPAPESKRDSRSSGKTPELLWPELDSKSALYGFSPSASAYSSATIFISKRIEDSARNDCGHAKLVASQAWWNDPIEKYVRLVGFIGALRDGISYAGLDETTRIHAPARIEALDLPFLSHLCQDLRQRLSEGARAAIRSEAVSIDFATASDAGRGTTQRAGHIDILRPRKSGDQLVMAFDSFARSHHAARVSNRLL